ncbi:hypothetical protein B0H16DRAFT_1689420 [Mycena metata]|uniref:Uncharacterized protein n=1 Tax=Mycena metata TaxID=1033252 RepID=A0AAD7J677_9AGAR|nr:hypothetical protein B0H16DRAFT_1689420 [Mycena metata]
MSDCGWVGKKNRSFEFTALQALASCVKKWRVRAPPAARRSKSWVFGVGMVLSEQVQGQSVCGGGTERNTLEWSWRGKRERHARQLVLKTDQDEPKKHQSRDSARTTIPTPSPCASGPEHGQKLYAISASNDNAATERQHLQQTSGHRSMGNDIENRQFHHASKSTESDYLWLPELWDLFILPEYSKALKNDVECCAPVNSALKTVCPKFTSSNLAKILGLAAKIGEIRRRTWTDDAGLKLGYLARKRSSCFDQAEREPHGEPAVASKWVIDTERDGLRWQPSSLGSLYDIVLVSPMSKLIRVLSPTTNDTTGQIHPLRVIPLGKLEHEGTGKAYVCGGPWGKSSRVPRLGMIANCNLRKSSRKLRGHPLKLPVEDGKSASGEMEY